MELRHLDIHIQKNETAYLSFTILRKIAMWIRLKHKAWNWKILRGKQEKYHNIGLGSDFANAEDIRDAGLTPGPGRSPGEGNSNPLQDSYLENPMDRGAWWAMVHRFRKNWTRLKWLCTHTSNFSVIRCMVQGSYAESCSARSTPFSKYTVLFPLIYMVADDLLNTNWTIFTVEGLYLSDFLREIKNPTGTTAPLRENISYEPLPGRLTRFHWWQWASERRDGYRSSRSSSGTRTYPGSANLMVHVTLGRGESCHQMKDSSSLVAHPDPIKPLVGTSHWG